MSEQAILMAAGLGNRMRPLTDTTPKPLVTVNGIPLVETVIAALETRGVRDIYIVTGYLAEKFAPFVRGRPRLHLLHNPEYATKNNINSVAVAADILRRADTFICEADLFIPDKTLLSRPLDRSGYFGKFVPGLSDDWLFDVADGRITGVHKHGTDKFNMVGVSYFKQADAAAIADAVAQRAQDPAWAQKFWDDVVDDLVKPPPALDLVVHQVLPGDIVECDTVDDLNQLEKSLCK